MLAPRRHGDGFAAALTLAEVDVSTLLGPGSRHGAHDEIASLTAGYIVAAPKELVRTPRKQVVVAVTVAGDVFALDHNLKKLWHAKLADHFPQPGHLAEVDVLVTEHAAAKGDRGMVVVGARQSSHTLAEALEEGDAIEEEIVAEGLERVRAHGRGQGEQLHEVDTGGGASGRHFSYFAFSGGSGDIRWKHEAQDFHRDLGRLQDAPIVTQHAIHAAAQLQDGLHFGEASCREYREAVLAALPHR